MKKSSLVALSLLIAASLGIVIAFPGQLSIKSFVLNVYSTAFGNSNTQKVEAQTAGNGTATIVAQICQTLENFANTSDATCSVTPTSPSADLAKQFSYDIQHWVNTGTNTQ